MGSSQKYVTCLSFCCKSLRYGGPVFSQAELQKGDVDHITIPSKMGKEPLKRIDEVCFIDRYIYINTYTYVYIYIYIYIYTYIMYV